MSVKMNANDLLEWINQLTDEEREVEIVMSRKIFPKDEDLLIPYRLGRWLNHGEYNQDLYVMLVANIDEFTEDSEVRKRMKNDKN